MKKHIHIFVNNKTCRCGAFKSRAIVCEPAHFPLNLYINAQQRYLSDRGLQFAWYNGEFITKEI